MGTIALIVAVLGLLFVAASLSSLLRHRRAEWSGLRDLVFLLGLTALFAFQLAAGVDAHAHPRETGPVNTIGLLVIVCFFIGIARSWELMGGPTIGFVHEIGAVARSARQQTAGENGDDAPPGGEGASPSI